MINYATLKHSMNSLLNKFGYLLVCMVFLGAANFGNAVCFRKAAHGDGPGANQGAGKKLF